MVGGTALLYDSATGAWTPTGSTSPREGHVAVRMQNGKVLVAGGGAGIGIHLGMELYDPSTGTWSGTGAIGQIRRDMIGSLLPNGKVLLAGGSVKQPSGYIVVASADLYDPETGLLSPADRMVVGRSGVAATLPHGRVLIV